jgi:methyl-accepting chemotaxis protein
MGSWTISRRIVAGFILLVALAVALGLTSVWRMMGIGGHVETLSTNTIPSLVALSRIMEANITAVRAVSTGVMRGDEPAAVAESQRSFDGAVSRGAKLCGHYRSGLISDDQDRTIFTAAEAARDSFLESARRAFALVTAGKARDAEHVLETEVEPRATACLDLFDRNVAYNLERSTADVAAARNMAAGGMWLVGGLVAGMALLGGLLGAGIGRWAGNALRTIAAALGDGAAQTAVAAGELAAVSDQLASGSAEQGASVAETSASLEQMSAMIRSTADNASQAKELAAQARDAAEAGARTMTEMNAAMTAIEASSAEVAKIVKDIDEIAFQTNILALNAAVEAARAGEAGAGFAVVADEVRSLAQRSAAAARQTAEKIEAAIASSRHGADSCDRVNASLGAIAGTVTAADRLVAEIATAAREQAQGIKQIGLAMTQLDNVTQGNAVRAEQGASAVARLTSQAEVMREHVAWLHALVIGGGPAAAVRSGRVARSAWLEPPAAPPAGAPRIPMPGDAAAGEDADDRHFREF